MKADINYMVYIKGVNENLLARGFRPLEFVEVCGVIGHLIKVVEAFPEEDIGGLNLLETLALESVKRALELHPDAPNPTPESITDAVNAMVDDEVKEE